MRGLGFARALRPWLLLCLSLVACAALSDDMKRVETAFSEARYEDVRVWLKDLEPSVPDMSRKLRTQYYYVAGITSARLGDNANARHYLALCREEASTEGFGLSEERQRNLALTLREVEGEGEK
jgi:hypothetical protein